MDSKVYEAALQGNVNSLQELLKQDTCILDRCGVGVEGNPLHIAAFYGHTLFAKEILNIKPEFVRESNSQGYLPLHLASAKGNVEMVKDLSQVDPETCLVRDEKGRIPLHTAAIKGRVEVLEALVLAKPVTTRVLTKDGESILHLCLKQENNLFECIKKLVELVDVEERDEFFKLKDDDDNTLLHLSTTNRQIKTIEFLLGKVDVNAVNVKGFTALDVLLESSEESSGDGRIERKLRSAGVRRSKVTEKNMLQILGMACSGGSRNKKQFEKEKASLNDARNTLMVVAILIATVTYTSGLTPPGGFWQGEFKTTKTGKKTVKATDHSGVAVLAIRNNLAYLHYIIFNSVGFVASLSIILLLISGFPIRRRGSRISLMVILWVAISSMVISYTAGVLNTCKWALDPADKTPRKATITFVSLGFMGLLLLGGPFARLVAQWRRKSLPDLMQRKLVSFKGKDREDRKVGEV